MSIHLVTGGNGFIGSTIVKELVKQNKKVRVIDIIDPVYRIETVEYIKGNILDNAALTQAVLNVNTVFHAAAIVPLAKNHALFWLVNTEGTKQLYSKCLKSDVKHFCHISSSAIYGDLAQVEGAVSEGSIALPIEEYGFSKKAAEEYLLEKMKVQGSMTCSIIRPRTVIGPGRLGIFHLLFHWIDSNSNVYIIGPGNNKIQFVHVYDLATAAIASADKKLHEALNIGAKNFGTLNDIITTLSRHAKAQSKIITIPIGIAQFILALFDKAHLSPLSKWHYKTSHLNYYFDISKAEKQLDWKPKYSNDEMMIEAFDFYRANKHIKIENKTHFSPIKWRILFMLRKNVK